MFQYDRIHETRILNRMKPIMLLEIILISFHCSFVSGSSTLLDIREILEGERAELQCILNSESTQLIWEHVQVGTVSSRTVVSGTEVLSGYSERFSINPDSNYTLVISKTLPQDAGLYMCRENTGRNSAEFELIVLESSPECSIVGEQTEAVSENSCGLPVDDLTLVCRVRYSGDVPPELLWKDGDDVVHSRTDVLDSIARNSITIKTKWDRKMYSCETNRSRSRCSMPVPRPLYIFNSSSHTVSHYPQNVTCTANTSLVCQYRWTLKSGLVSASQHLIITTTSQDGEYQCVADCKLKERNCTVLPMTIKVSLESNKPDKRLTAIIIALVVSTIVFCSIILIGVLCVPLDAIKSCRACVRNAFDCRRKNENEIATCAPEKGKLLESDVNSRKSGNLLRQLRTIKTSGYIKGITVLNDEIFIVRKGTPDMEKYVIKETFRKEIFTVAKLEEPIDLVSCKTNNRLYISDSVNGTVHIVEMPHMSSGIPWNVEKQPGGLSVTDNATLLVTFPIDKEIIEYTSSGKKMRTVTFGDTININHPRHAIQLKTESMLLVCNGKNIIDHQNLVFSTKDGKSIVKYFDGENTFGQTSMWPTRLAETQSGDIIVAAYQKVLLLDRDLKLINSELISVEKDHFPSRLFLDEKNKCLYITENDANGRILIYDIVIS